MVKKRNAYRILVGNPEEKRPLGRPRRRWVENIEIDFRELGWDGMNWIELAQDRDQWRALVNTIMNFWFRKMLGSSCVAAQLAASQEGLSFVVSICIVKYLGVNLRGFTGLLKIHPCGDLPMSMRFWNGGWLLFDSLINC
jgi:hypothetical protein